tara:strand:- start:4169 stop:4471 length:303 start_codon:yes stop_codon:yes gene_type:complete
MNIEETTKTWVKDRLTDSEFLVEFTKKNGDKRKMRCTLAPGYVPPATKEDPLTQKKVRAVNEEVQVVWDMDKKAWRSFRWDSVVGEPLRFPLGNGEDAQV